ncbi:MAG: endonuclease G, mitochondrial [bacterium P3]|nr:MAG: endonuclease G, mitochondrial [bacterium P3]KWW42723.1 MAG: endonuclease G, mitochondrial [bacterium F083]
MSRLLNRCVAGCIALALTAAAACHALYPAESQDAASWALPACIDSSAVVHHYAYSLEYSEADEQPRWVAYMLCRSRLDGPYSRNNTRGCQFRADDAIGTKSSSPADYKRSGYSRGHLVPAADMKWDSTALVETFLLSNISPQRADFNSGVWNRIEMQVRRWAERYDTLYIVTGPLLGNGNEERIGDNCVTVPDAFYKAVYIPSIQQAVGFLVAHRQSKDRLRTFAMSIDELEAHIGIDLFAGMPDEAAIESTFDSRIVEK